MDSLYDYCDIQMVCITVAISAICFFPLDVANAGGSLYCGEDNGTCGGLSFTYIWYALFVLIVILLCVVLPFTVFFYETVDIDQPPLEKRCQTACSYTFGTVIVVAALSVLYCMLIKRTDIPIQSFDVSADNTFVIDDTDSLIGGISNIIDNMNSTLSSEEIEAASKIVGTEDIQVINVSVIVRLISFFCIVGWLFFVIFAGIGIIGLPYKLIQ